MNYNFIPEHMRQHFKDYVEKGIPPGSYSFMMAVLTNNLVEAFALADSINEQYMRNYASFLYNDMPARAWGSEANVIAWCKHKQEGGVN